MSEDEYYDDEEFDEDDDREFGDSFLSDEDDDIDIIVLPKLDCDVDALLSGYLKTLKKAKTTEEAMSVLYQLHTQISAMSRITNEIDNLQEKAREIEAMMDYMKIR